ncbi:MAG: hypothetical protein AAGD35_16900 [Actinomycetota bacterium]
MVALLLVLAAASSTAGAQTDLDDLDCAADVIDEVGVLDDVTIRAAATSVDARVVVWSFDTVPDGDLAELVDERVLWCFGADDGSLPGDLAVFAFAVDDRLAGVLLGPTLPGPPVPQDLTDTMTAPFADGFYTEGVVGAIDELDQRLGGATDAGDTAEPSATDGTDGTEAGGDTEGTGDTGGGPPPGAVAGGVVAAAGAAGAWALARRRRRLQQARAALGHDIERPLVRVGAVREQAYRLEAQAELWAKTVAGRTMETLAEVRHRCRSATGETERAAALLGEATPDGIDSASADEVERARGRLTELNEALDRNERHLDELFALGARLDHLRVALPSKHELLLDELDEADELAAERTEEGWAVEIPATELEQVRATLDAVDLDAFELDLLSLSDEIERAEARLFAADHDLQVVPDRPAALAEWRSRQQQAAELEHRRVDNSRSLLAAVAAEHAAASWEWAADHPDDAVGLLAESATLGDDAVAAAEEQRFDEAGRLLEHAGLRLMAADDLLDQVEDLSADLAAAKAESTTLVVSARAVAAEFVAFVGRHRGDLDEHLVARPRRVDEELAGLDAELALARPNHLRVARSAERLGRELDELLATAVEQHERMEALRRQAERERNNALRAIARARQSIGWELFRSSDTRTLDELERRLVRLPDDPEERIAEARYLADEAVAIQEMAIARRRRQSNWVVVGGDSGHRADDSLGNATFGGTRSRTSTRSSRSSAGRSFGRGGSAGRSFGGGRGSGRW